MFSPPGEYTSPLVLPMTVGQIIAETFRLYRQNFLTFFMIALLTALPALILTLILNASPVAQEYITVVDAWAKEVQQTPLGSTAPPPQIDPAALGSVIRFGILSLGLLVIKLFLFRSLAIGATTLAVAEAYAKERATAGGAAQALRHTGALIAWGLLLGAVVLGPIFLAAFLLSAAAGGDPNAALCLIMLLVLVSLFACFLLGRLLFGARAIVAEELSVVQAWRRTWQLTSTNYWRILGIALLMVLGTWLVGLAINFPFNQLLEPAGSTDSLSLGTPLLYIVEMLIGALLAPIVYISLTLLYYDERRIQETPAIGSGSPMGLQ